MIKKRPPVIMSFVLLLLYETLITDDNRCPINQLIKALYSKVTLNRQHQDFLDRN